MCLIKMDTDQQRDRQTDGNGRQLFRTVGVMKCRENIKVAIRPMDSITIFPSFTLGKITKFNFENFVFFW